MGSNTYTKGYADGSALTEAQLDNAYQSLQLDISNTANMTTGSTAGQALISTGSGSAAAFSTISDPQGPFALRNYGLKATVATGVMTVSLKTKALATPSGTDIVDFNYSTNGTTSASYTSVQITAATTFTLNTSASLGATSTTTLRIYTYGYYNTVTASVKLAVSSRPDFDRGAAIAMTAVSAAADSAAILYASAALTVVPRLLGWVEAAHSSAGAWQTPSKVNITQNSPTSPFELNRASTTSAGRIGEIAISAEVGLFASSATAYTDVTGLTATITTTGRPVIVECVPSADGNNISWIKVYSLSATESGTMLANFKCLRGTSSIGVHQIGGESNFAVNKNAPFLVVPSASIHFLDTPVAGTYTYKIQGFASSGMTSPNFSVAKTKLVVREI